MANYESINLEKGMYVGDFTTALEKIDPSINYHETPLEGMDAFERQLKRFDIRVSGSGSDRIEKFFQSSDSAVLFPEYVSRAVKQGMKDADMLDNIVATTTQIEAPDYRPLNVENEGVYEFYPEVYESGQIPEITIRNSSNLVSLKKRGCLISTTYEALRFHRLDLFTVVLKQLGAQIAREQFDDAVEVLLNSPRSVDRDDIENISYNDLLKLWTAVWPYKLNTLIVAPNKMIEIMRLKQFRDSSGGLNFHASGNIITPFGATLVPSAKMSEDEVLGIDSNCALEMITAGGVLLESNKLIDRQLENATISSLTGFTHIFPAACHMLTLPL